MKNSGRAIEVMTTRPKCSQCGSLNVQTAEWVRWTDQGPRLELYGDSPPVPEWCENCESETDAEWVAAD